MDTDKQIFKLADQAAKNFQRELPELEMEEVRSILLYKAARALHNAEESGRTIENIEAYLRTSFKNAKIDLIRKVQRPKFRKLCATTISYDTLENVETGSNLVPNTILASEIEDNLLDLIDYKRGVYNE